MDRLKQSFVNDLQEARHELLAIPKATLSYSTLIAWYTNRSSLFQRVQWTMGDLLDANMVNSLRGFDTVSDAGVLLDLRARLISMLDQSVTNIDQQQIVRPILDDLILKVQDTKLSTLLREFNSTKDTNPNLAALGFRTIVSLLIFERAKIEKPGSPLASRQDISFDRDIRDALKEHIFSPTEERLLHKHLTGGKKDTFDIVCHKVGPNTLVDKGDLSDAVDLLNRLLPTIV